MGHDRRRSTRLAAGWSGRYTLDTRPHDPYQCRVLDISLGGASLELFGPAPLEYEGIRVEFRSEALPVGLHLPARARHLGPSTSTGMRVGVEWHDLTRAHAIMLNAILRRTHIRAATQATEISATG
jgi:c-di-GMP-binding flagellar brake protein YcgR